MEDLIGKIHKKESEQAGERSLTRMKGDGNQIATQRNMKLQFKNRISQRILTGEEIKGECENHLQVALVHESTGNIVDVGPESSATVRILLLKSDATEGDDWTVEQFNENIVREVEGKKPLLAGNLCLKLRNGIGFLENIKFRHHATNIVPSGFRLGARVVDSFHGVGIKEAKTQSFVVKDYRNKYYIKHDTPSLLDEVCRLKNIRKGGEIEKRLRDHKIYTVENFLIQHLIDPEGLKKIVGKKWKLAVDNALACPRDKRLYCYTNEQKTMGVVFNLLGQILGLYMGRRYTSTNMLSEKHKAKAKELLESAKHWEKVKHFDDEDSLQQYFNGLDCPVGGHENAQTFELIGESSSRSNFSISAMNSISETGVEDFSSFSIDDVGNVHEGFLQQYLDALDCPFGGHENAQTSEMIGESSSRSNFSISAMNSFSETGVENFSSFGFLPQYLDALYCPVGGHKKAQTSEMIGESSSRSNFSISAMNSISETGVENSSSFGIDDGGNVHEGSLQQYLDALDCPVGGHENVQTFEMIGESSSRSNFSVSAMNSFGETGVENFSPFGIDDVENMHHAFLQPFDNHFPGNLEEHLYQNDTQDRPFDGLINETNAGEFVDLEYVQRSSKPRNLWGKLRGVWKRSLIRKKVSVKGIRKQKVG